MEKIVCAFTGHRPKSFPWKYDESAPDCILPCKGQEDKWPVSEQKRYHSILRQANDVVLVNRKYSAGCMLERNRYMVDHSSFLLAVYNGSIRSGTGATIRYAQQMGRSICVLNPVTCNISYNPQL